MSDRKLIRPTMTEMIDRFPNRTSGRRKQVPAEQTNAENFYYLKQMQSRTQMVVVLLDGTELTGCIEWYDKTCIKLNRPDAPNLLLARGRYLKLVADQHFLQDHIGQEAIDRALHGRAHPLVVQLADVRIASRANAEFGVVHNATGGDLLVGRVG